MTYQQRTPDPSSRHSRLREPDTVIPTPLPTIPPAGQREIPAIERIGSILKRARIQRGDDLQQIADYLCIRRSYLDAIESGDYDKLPADAYVVGFLRSYADLLGVNGQEAIEMYRAEMAGRRKKPSLILPTPVPEGRAPSVFVMVGAILSAIFIYALWYGLSSPDRATINIAPPLPTTPAAEITPAPASPSTNLPVVATEPEATVEALPIAQSATLVPQAKPTVPSPTPTSVASTGLIIKAEQSSWILIVDNEGNTVIDRVLKPGESYGVPNKSGLTLTTGNAGGITLLVDGTDLPKLSNKPAGIMRNISLDAERLKSLKSNSN
jgi:cytoskeleton protein RodZ